MLCSVEDAGFYLYQSFVEASTENILARCSLTSVDVLKGCKILLRFTEDNSAKTPRAYDIIQFLFLHKTRGRNRLLITKI